MQKQYIKMFKNILLLNVFAWFRSNHARSIN